MDNDQRLKTYQHHGRRDRVLLNRSELDQLDPAAAHLLYATNARARIKYTRIARRKLLAQLGERGTREPVAFVSLVNRRYTLPVAEAGMVDLVSLKAWVRAELPGTSFVGVAEAAFYGNVHLAETGVPQAVCWHTHLLLWGVGRVRLAELIKSVSRRNLTLVPGAAAGHSRLLRPDKIEAQIIYMFKGAVSEYRIWQHREDVADEFGELRREGTGKFYQRKQPLRLGDLARMTRVLSDQYLDGLTFAAGEGKPILKAINEAAPRPLPPLARRCGAPASVAREHACRACPCRGVGLAITPRGRLTGLIAGVLGATDAQPRPFAITYHRTCRLRALGACRRSRPAPRAGRLHRRDLNPAR